MNLRLYLYTEEGVMTTTTKRLTVVPEVLGCKVQGYMDPLEPQGVQVVLVDRVGLDLHEDQGDHVGHPLVWPAPEKTDMGSY